MELFTDNLKFVYLYIYIRVARPTFLPTFDKSHCDKRHSAFNNGLIVYVEKQRFAMKVSFVSTIRYPFQFVHITCLYSELNLIWDNTYLYTN